MKSHRQETVSDIRPFAGSVFQQRDSVNASTKGSGSRPSDKHQSRSKTLYKARDRLLELIEGTIDLFNLPIQLCNLLRDPASLFFGLDNVLVG